MRICSPQLGLSPSSTRGGEVYDHACLTRMAQAGAEIVVLLPAGLPEPQTPNLEIIRLPLRRGYRWQVSNLYFVPLIGRAYRRKPFDLLRVHSLRFTGLACLWARRIYRLPVPIVAHHHHTDPDRWTDVVDGSVARAADRLMVGSQATAQDVTERFGIAPQRLTVAPYGIDDAYHPGVRDAYSLARPDLAGKALVLHVGSLIGRKNIAGLLAAFAQVVAALPHAHLVLLGGGPKEADLRGLAHRLGIAQAVDFAGRVDEATKLAYYARADLLVSASQMEGFGLAVGEAMACGVPVVATRAGSLPEIVEANVTGLLVPPGDADALAAAMIAVLRDPALAQRFAAAGPARIDHLFRWPRTVAQTLACYQETIEQCALP